MFSPLRLTEDEDLACSSESIIRSLGTIQLKIYRGTVGTQAGDEERGDGGYEAGIDQVKEMVFDESAAKVKGNGVSHQAGYVHTSLQLCVCVDSVEVKRCSTDWDLRELNFKRFDPLSKCLLWIRIRSLTSHSNGSIDREMYWNCKGSLNVRLLSPNPSSCIVDIRREDPSQPKPLRLHLPVLDQLPVHPHPHRIEHQQNRSKPVPNHPLCSSLVNPPLDSPLLPFSNRQRMQLDSKQRKRKMRKRRGLSS